MREDFDEEVTRALEDAGVNLVLCVGYMRILSADFCRHWAGRCLNVHPSLLPDFAGGMDLQVRGFWCADALLCMALRCVALNVLISRWNNLLLLDLKVRLLLHDHQHDDLQYLCIIEHASVAISSRILVGATINLPAVLVHFR